jgi:hypothetical protein
MCRKSSEEQTGSHGLAGQSLPPQVRLQVRSTAGGYRSQERRVGYARG